jgi:phosphoribosylanthranilate isomerase
VIGVKICGVCHPEDAVIVAASGATHIGVIVGADGPRLRSVQQAAAIYEAAADLVRVGVFANVAGAEVVRLARCLGLGVVQLHGQEAPGDAATVASEGPWQVWKAIQPTDAASVVAAVALWGGVVDALLIDGAAPGRMGGSGITAPWRTLSSSRWQGRPALVLAGGLRPENVAEAVAWMAPDVVDVSSGVEADVGRKGPDLVRAFVRHARAARSVAAIPEKDMR